MDDIITDTHIKLRSVKTGRIYDAHYIVERPAGGYGMVWAGLVIKTCHGILIEAYKPTIGEATDRLKAQLAGKWERA